MSAYKDKETSTAFYFTIPFFVEDFGTHNFEIKWATHLDRKVTDQIYNSGQRAGEWQLQAAQYYSTGIVADIKLDWR